MMRLKPIVPGVLVVVSVIVIVLGLSTGMLAATQAQEPSTEMQSSPQACNYSAIVLADSPMAYWRLGEMGGTTAVNIGGLGSAVNGTYMNGVTLGVGGLVAGDADLAASFDGGSDYVSIPNHLEINTGGPYTVKTIELWFKASTLAHSQVLYEQGGGTNGLNVFIEDDRLWVGAWADDVGSWVNTTVVADTVYHVALVFDGSAQTVAGYLDGTSFGSLGTPFSSLPSHGAAIGIGAINGDTRYPSGDIIVPSGDYFEGVIDEVALYNAVLAPARIQAHAQGCGLTCHALALGHTGQGSDPVATPAHSDGCPAGQYVYGQSIQLSGVTPATGWQIRSWYGTHNNGSTAATNTVTMPDSAHPAGVNYIFRIYLPLILGHSG